MSLKEIQKGIKKKKPKLIIYGSSGVGKKTFAFKNDKVFIATKDNKNEN